MTEADVNCYVYLYRDADGVPRYIGKGTKLRMREHEVLARALNEGRRKNRATHFTSWLAKCLRAGAKFSSEIVAADLADEDAFLLEGYLILYYGRFREPGGTLYNINAGGDGFTREDAKRCSMRPEVRKKKSVSLRKAFSNPEVKARLVAGTTEANGRPHRREQQAEMARARWADPKKKRRLAKATKANWDNGTHEVNRAKLIERNKSPEQRAASGAVLRALWADPAFRAKVSARMIAFNEAKRNQRKG